MSIPAPVLFVLVILVGWPLMQIASVLIARPFRKRLKDMAIDLGSDPQLTSRDRAAIEDGLSFARAGRGEPATAAIMAVTPLVLPFYILADAFRELLVYPRHEQRRDLAGDGLKSDPKFAEFWELSLRIGWLRRPVAAVLAIILSLPTVPFAILAFGFSEIQSELKKVVDRFTRLAMQA